MPTNITIRAIKGASLEQLLDLWESTTSAPVSLELATVRGWLMDEIQRRRPAGFDAWLDAEYPDDADLRPLVLLNPMCLNCASRGRTCSGTTCQTWTGCVYYKGGKIKRTFEHYKSRLIRESHNTDGIRFNGIQYLCQFPGIDPVEMAASLQNDGYNILFDDSSITKAANKSNMAKVNKAAKALLKPSGRP